MNPVLAATRAKREAAQTKLESLMATPAAEGRSLTDAEASTFEKHAAKIQKLDHEIEMLEAAEARKSAATGAAVEAAPAPARVTSEPLTYSERSKNSYMLDMVAVSIPQAGLDVEGAQARLARHAQEMEVEARSNADIAWRLQSAKEQRATDSASGYGGDLIAPLYLIDNYVPVFRPGRPAANRVTNLPLPAGTNSINVPKITTGTQIAAQGSPTGATVASVNTQDLVTSTVTAAVNTYAGQTDVSLQLLEQSSIGIGIDQVVFRDLAADYDQRIDTAILSGSGSSGQHLGVLTYVTATATSSLVFTGAAGTGATAKGGSYNAIVKGVNAIETSRYANPTGVWVHPQRANTFGATVDSNGRPLYVRSENMPWNALGVDTVSPQYQGVAGELYGLPVVKDANIPTNWLSTTSAAATSGGAAGTTAQDVIVVAKEDDLMLWEGPLRLRVLPEVSSGTLAVRFQLYAYSAFMPNRASSALAVITGPALNATSLGF